MKNPLIICLTYFIALQAVAQPNIVKAEYYVDTDPGFGNATNIPVTAAIDIANQTFAVGLNNVQEGMHAVFMRSMNANGHWSLTNPLFFYKPPTITAVGNITYAEYYFDNDPGFGVGTSIALNPASDIQNQVFPTNINNLSPGIHILFIRSQNEGGQWSITNQLVFYKKEPTGAISPITKAEYYFDSDPGFGFAENIALTDGADLQNISFDAAIGHLSVGIHILLVRSKDGNGLWSVTNQLVYYKKNATTDAPNVTRAEYYFDNDPGFGLAETIIVTAGTNVQDISLLANIQTLTTGLHLLCMRTSDAYGQWGITNQLLFYKPPPPSGAITDVEYFYDSDPGFGLAIPVAINPITNLANYLAPVNITGLTVGDHQLFLRSKSSSGWSITNVFPFQIAQEAATPFININSITNTTNCAWDNFRISFHATGNYLPNNTFTVQLSNANGAFTAPINIGQVSGIGSSEVRCQLPAHLPDGAAYRIRVISSNTPVTGLQSAGAVTIHDRPHLGSDTTVFIVCANETIDLWPLYDTTNLTALWSTANPLTAGKGNYQLIASNVYGCKDTSIATVRQDVAVWTGSVSSNWHLAANWGSGKIPTAKTHVLIDDTAIRACEVVDADGIAASLQVKKGAIIKLLNNHKLLLEANCNPLPDRP